MLPSYGNYIYDLFLIICSLWNLSNLALPSKSTVQKILQTKAKWKIYSTDYSNKSKSSLDTFLISVSTNGTIIESIILYID